MAMGAITEGREVRAAGFGAAVVAAYMGLILLSGRVDPGHFALLFLFYLKMAANLWLLMAVPAVLWLLHSKRPRAGEAPARPFIILFDWLRDRWARDRFVALLWPPLLFAALIPSFNAFKQLILPAAGMRFDPLFAEMDRWLFLGIDPWRITHGLFGTPAATFVIDRAYHAWFLPMVLGVIVCAWLPGTSFRLRTQYLLSYIMMWVGAGTLLAFLMPAAGPCFYQAFAGPEPSFAALAGKLAADQAALGAPLSALAFQDMLLGAFGREELIIGGGISAMPSVHNGLAALFAFAAFRINRVLGWAMTFYAGLIWIGSIHLGWHYAIDGLLAFGLAWGIWRIAGRLAAWLERPGPGQRPVPALA